MGTQEGKCPTLLYIFLLWLAPRHNHRSINIQISMNASESTGHLHWLHSSFYRDSLQSQSAKIYNLSSMSWACRSYPKKRHLGGILVWCQCHLSSRLSVKRNSNSTLSLSHMTKLDTLWLRHPSEKRKLIPAACIHNFILLVTGHSSWPQVGVGP